MEDNYYTSSDNQKLYISYFDALYLLNIVFEENKKFEFIDASHVESIWNSTEYKYHKFCVIKAYKYELGGFEVQIGDEYKGVCDDLVPKENSNITYNPLSYDGNPDFKKSYWKRRDNALNSFTDGDENLKSEVAEVFKALTKLKLDNFCEQISIKSTPFLVSVFYDASVSESAPSWMDLCAAGNCDANCFEISLFGN